MITPDVSAPEGPVPFTRTRVLQFAFDGNADNPYLPENYVPNSVVYTGTHDNNTTRGWFAELPDSQRQNIRGVIWKRPPDDDDDRLSALLRLAWSSKAALAMAPLQDLLNLGTEARMNVPGRARGATGGGTERRT